MEIKFNNFYRLISKHLIDIRESYFLFLSLCFALRMAVSSLSLATSSFEGRIPSTADEEITERSISSSDNKGSFKYGLVSFKDFLFMIYYTTGYK